MSAISVPFQNFRAPYEELREELDAAFHRFMESGWFVLGKETLSFEEEYAAYCNAQYCVGVSNGLDALHLALRALGVRNGDEVIVPSNTYIATWLAVSQTGARPVPVEPNPLTFNIDAHQVEAAITLRTKAILAVNLYGQPCDYDCLLAISRHHGLKLVIDNAQAQGASYRGRRVGGIADVECHSFYPSKNLGAYGEAGAVTSNDAEIADQLRVLRNYGSRVRYHNEVQGYNNRIDELQAAFLRVKLRKLDEWNERRSAVARQYLQQLAAFSSEIFSTHGFPLLPTIPQWADPVWHLFVIRHPARNDLQNHLDANGIQTIIHYPIPPHLSGAYASEATISHICPIAESLASSVLSLPIGPHLTTKEIEFVISCILSFKNHAL
jgi:dTDP-4-amino-4,6-dideoxygalactose transaminase